MEKPFQQESSVTAWFGRLVAVHGRFKLRFGRRLGNGGRPGLFRLQIAVSVEQRKPPDVIGPSSDGSVAAFADKLFVKAVRGGRIDTLDPGAGLAQDSRLLK